MKQLFRSCPICTNPKGKVLHKQLFSLPSNSPLPHELDIVFCSNCGFVFADTPVNQLVYNEYYTLLSKYEDIEISTGSGTDSFDLLRLEAAVNIIQRILPFKSAKILDMGCANGGLLKVLNNLGYQNVIGVDPSETCIKHIESCGIKCIKGDIFSQSFQDLSTTFDCIILTHVLEHIYDLNTAIENLSSKLNDNGVLYIEVPDASHYSDFFIVPYYYIDCEHINHFDKNSLSNLICSKGFTQIETQNINFKVNESTNYPAVYSVFKKTKQSIFTGICLSDHTQNSFLNFIRQSQTNNGNDKLIQLFVESQEPVYIWGAGQFTMRLLKNSALGECNIQGFIDSDSNKQGKKIKFQTIFPPSHLIQNNISVIICSALHHIDIEKTIKTINDKIKVFIMK
jgi:hypothetical protein